MNAKYFDIARSISKLSTFHKSPTGCIVVYRKQIISTGYNQFKTHPLQQQYNKYRFTEITDRHCVHAEIDALSKIRFHNIDWSKVDLYVYREHRQTGELMLSRPCESCMRFISKLGIKNIYYTGYGSYNYELRVSA